MTDASSSADSPLANTSPVWQRAWHPVAPAAEVTGGAPAQVLVAGEAWVLARLDGRLVAFEDQCPHQRSPLSAGCITRAADGTARLTCAAHGWRFDAAGRRDLIPALGGLRGVPGWAKWRTRKAGNQAGLRAAHGVIEAYGLIWLAPQEPRSALPAFPEWDAPGMTCASATAVRTNASAAQVIDSFLTAPGFPGERAPGAPGVSGTAHARLQLPHATIGILLACQPEDWMTTRVFTLIACGDGATGAIGS